jgi:phosphoglycolate phosphatase (TIGR01487 family)
MHYVVLASDYDGTLAHEGVVSPQTIQAVHRLKSTGRKFVLVTGRLVSDLLQVFPELDICDSIVAENGGVLYNPKTEKYRPLASSPPEEFIRVLMDREVRPLAIGKVIVATVQPHEQVVMETIRELGLELQIIFNKGAVMILPTGINKATGLQSVMNEFGIPMKQVAGIGDAENDHAFLAACGFSVAVSNSVESLKKIADYVSSNGHGKGVIEIIESMAQSDLQDLEQHF